MSNHTPEETCGACPTFIESVSDGGVCGDCRSGLYRKKAHPACSTRLRELDMLAVLEAVEWEKEGYCMFCNRYHTVNHAKDCQLNEACKKARGA